MAGGVSALLLAARAHLAKVSNKRFWLELPTTLATAKRFFIGDKKQSSQAAVSESL